MTGLADLVSRTGWCKCSMANPRRTRDYAAEERRRNERARQLGFTTRAQQRRALKHGYAPPRKGSSPRSPIAYEAAKPLRVFEVEQYTAKARKPRPIGGGTGTRNRRLRRESSEWSRQHSRVPASQYRPELSDEAVERYHAAFVHPKTRAWKIENGLDSLRAWLVDEMGFYTDDVFDIRYGIDIDVTGMTSFPKS